MRIGQGLERDSNLVLVDLERRVAGNLNETGDGATTVARHVFQSGDELLQQPVDGSVKDDRQQQHRDVGRLHGGE